MKYLLPFFLVLTGCGGDKSKPEPEPGVTDAPDSPVLSFPKVGVRCQRITIEGKDYYLFINTWRGGVFVMEAPKATPEVKP